MSIDNTNTAMDATCRQLKRTYDDANNKLSSDWISASKTRNSALDDKCMDYFEMYGINDISDRPMKRQKITSPHKSNDEPRKTNDEPMNANSFTEFILTSGIQFENDIIKKIQQKFPNDFIKICEPYEAIYKSKCDDTVKAMIDGIPIIYQGVVHNPTSIYEDGDEKTFGAVDLLVRSDFINQFVTHEIMLDNEINIPSPKLKKDFHYRVVDIKWTKLHFNVNRQTLRNNPNVKPFKTQLTIYNEALGYMQGYTPPSAYILGNGWICEKNRRGRRIVTKNNDPFDRFGKIDFTFFDKGYIEKSSDAILWYRELQNQTDFTHDPPNRDELYPNMNNSYDGRFHHVKEQIASKYSEITQIWNCGVKERETALASGVSNWRDPKFSAQLVGLHAGKKQKIIDAIVEFNRNGTDVVSPLKITNDTSSAWQGSAHVAFYVDFETIQENLIDQQLNGDYIFMIGIGYIDATDSFIYNNLTTKDLSLASERNIISDFLETIEKLSGNKKSILFHWGQHERTTFMRAIERHGNCWTMPNFVDFCKIMTDEPILVRGAYDFGLKTVAKAMYKNKLINTIWTGDMCDGATAMFLGWKEYINLKPSDDILNSQVIKKIIDYNKIDCQTMSEIIEYLKNKHIGSPLLHKGISNTNENNCVGNMADKSDDETVKSGGIEIKKTRKRPIGEVTINSDDEQPKKKQRPSEKKQHDVSTISISSDVSDEEWKPPRKDRDNKKIINPTIIRSTHIASDISDSDKYDSDFVVDDDAQSVDTTISSVDACINACDNDFTTSMLEVLINKVFDNIKDATQTETGFSAIKNTLLQRMVTLNEIRELVGTTDEEKATLIEKFISCMTMTGIDEFIRERNELKKIINTYRTTDVAEKNKLNEIKNRLENCGEHQISLEKRILNMDIDDNNKKIIYDKYKQLCSLHVGSETYVKLKEWLDHVLAIPFNVIKPIKPNDVSITKYLEHVKKTLDENLYGMTDAKEELLLILNNKLRNPESFKNTIALVGHPGTGKTALIIAMCKALNLPYSQISLGGKHDTSFFLGHSYTYEGSRPGQIVTSLQQMGRKDGILFFDEFDKLEEREGKKGISNLLLHITDFTQNDRFSDEYIADIPIDLSKLWFVFSLNDEERVEPILRNRMTFIHVPSYTTDDKINIMKNYIVPKCNKQFQFGETDLIFTNDVIKYILKKTKVESGVREMERNIITIYKRVNLLRSLHEDNETNSSIVKFAIANFKLPFCFSEHDVDTLMTAQQSSTDDAFKTSIMYM